MKVILYMATSLNGYIAEENGSEDFLSHDNWITFLDLAKKTGNIIWGRKTYEAVSQWSEKYQKDLTTIPTKICISKNPQTKSKNGFDFVSSPQEALNLLGKKGYREALLSGGSTNNSSFAKKDLIDEVIFNLEPSVLGKGIPVFKQEDFTLKLEFIGVNRITSNIPQLHYKVIK